jgi:fumarate hydratase class II
VKKIAFFGIVKAPCFKVNDKAFTKSSARFNAWIKAAASVIEDKSSQLQNINIWQRTYL